MPRYIVQSQENGTPYSKSSIERARREGKKTSYIEPDTVIAKSGAEMFRLWVASTEFRADITYSQKILDGLGKWYEKLRNASINDRLSHSPVWGSLLPPRPAR